MTDRERINTIYDVVSARNVPGDPHLNILFRISDLVDVICDARRDLGGEVDLRLRAEIHVSVMNSIMDWEEEICPGNPTIAQYLSAPENRPVGHKLTRWA